MDSERTIEDARSVCHDLRTLFEQDSDFHEATLDEAERLCEIARLVIDDRRCLDEIAEVERYARRLLSDDRWRSALDALPGADFQRRTILALLKAVDTRLTSLAIKNRPIAARYDAGVTRRNRSATRTRVHS